MSDANVPVHIAQAEIQAALEIARVASMERDEWKARALKAESIISHLRTSLNEQHNDPMNDGRPDGR